MKVGEKILAIETSCDETSVALIECLGAQKYKVHAQETISQINLHREFGGVYPTLSRREHEKNLIPLVHKVLNDSSMLHPNDIGHENIIEILGTDLELLERYPDLKENVFDFFCKFSVSKIDYIAVTNGPGLPPALWVGVNFSKIISVLMGGVPLYPVNHMEGHVIGGISKRIDDGVVVLEKISYPATCLLISGGHTELVSSSMSGKYLKVGETQDDAVGEAYDKVARLLGLPYPGGPEIGKLARTGRDAGLLEGGLLPFPRPMIHSKDLNFSFSGLKTHILYLLQKNYTNGVSEEDKVLISTSFEEAVKDVLVKKTGDALENFGSQTLVVGGGVASNLYLKEAFEKLCNNLGVKLYISSRELSTDNALMIALCAANQIENGVTPSSDFQAIGSKNYEW